MRVIFGMVLVAGVGIAGTAVYMAKDYIGQYQAQLAQAQELRKQIVPTKTVYTTVNQLKYGDELKKSDVTAIRWPARYVPPGAFTDMEVLFPEGEEEPRLVVRQMEPGEPLLTVKLTEPGEDIGLTTRLEKGMRAFAIKVDVASGVSGFLRPGDRVDVYWTGRVAAVGGESVTKLIESQIQLIAVDQTDDELSDAQIARTVTVQATPRQVAALAQAQSSGRLSLSLVGVGDVEETAEVAVNEVSLLGIKTPEPVAQAEAPRICSVRQRMGGELTQVQIPCTN